MYICKECNNKFSCGPDFDNHPCVTNLMKLSPKELLVKMLKDKTITQEQYAREMIKLSKGK